MGIKLLDCTLRDGGYLVDKHFHEIAIHNIITGLTQARVDFVEVGFLQDEIGQNENVCFKGASEAAKCIPHDRGDTLYTAFADYSRYSIANLEDYDGTSFDCVRACFFKEERKDVLEFCREVKRKGYKLFVQPVGALRYSTNELLDLINDFNEISPYCFGIVDTFGSMFFEDLRLKVAIINSELDKNIALGFHSHSNLMLSNALTMEFVNLIKGERDCSVDATLYGMGRGAGNANTEIIAEYLNRFSGKNYDTDIISDVIDNTILNIASHTKYGYDLSMFLAGALGAHINNVDYLIQKAGLRTRDIRQIISKLSSDERARYLYEKLDSLYLEHFCRENTGDGIEKLRDIVAGRSVLVVAPGKTADTCSEDIKAYIEKEKPITIAINFVPQKYKADYIYFNNPRRYDYAQNGGNLANYKTIITTNVTTNDNSSIVIPFDKVFLKSIDNSVILLLKILDLLEVDKIYIAGFDGFDDKFDNYASNDLEKNTIGSAQKNAAIKKLFDEFMAEKNISEINFITPSKFN